MFKATVYNPDGTPAMRTHGGNVIGPLEFVRKSVHRAWLSARNYEYPPGVSIKVTRQPRRIAGTDLQAAEVVELYRGWEGEKWVDIATGKAVE